MELMTAPALHIRVNGQSQDLTYADVDLSLDASDAQVFAAVERHLDLPEGSLESGHTVARERGVTIVRPIAIYG